VIIAGPTAVGKTALAVQLARHYGTAVVSADTRQFFREMSIGTAKPTEAEMGDVPHYLIGHIGIHDTYNAGQYEREAMDVLHTLFKSHDLVILAGGSGMYINALCNGVDDVEETPAGLRDEINEGYRIHGLAWLQQQVQQLDPVYYAQVDQQNPQRLIRAIEVSRHTGKPYSSFRTHTKKQRDFEVIPILVNMDREALYARINARVDAMMAQGLLDEVKALYPYRHLNALQTVGYKELFAFLDGTVALPDAVEQIKQNTRRYAKRQLTWFNNQGDYESFGPGDLEAIKGFIDIIIENSD